MQGSFLSNFLNLNKNDWIDEILKNVNNINEIFYIFYKTLSEIVDRHLALMKVTRQSFAVETMENQEVKHFM